MKHISKYITSIFFVMLSFLSIAQEKDTVLTKKERYGLRVGIDLFKLSKSFYEKDYKGIELVGDYRLTRKYFLATEIGNENKTVDEAQLNFTTKGSFVKIGFDYNAYENWLDMENVISLGLRYGFSNFNQTLNSYKIYNKNQYFEDVAIIPSGEKFTNLSAHWIEVVAGMKAKVFNNIFVGFSLRLNTLTSQNKPNNFDNLYIPGFNRTYEGSFGVGFNYSVTYFIPLYKSEVKTKK